MRERPVPAPPPHGVEERGELEACRVPGAYWTGTGTLLHARRMLLPGAARQSRMGPEGSNGSRIALPRVPYTSNRRAVGAGSIAAMSTSARARG